MSDRFLAFRCFGTFTWPPVRSKTTAAMASQGVVEIHYVLDGALQKMVGCVRWVPKDLWRADLAFDTDLKTLAFLQGGATTLAQAQNALIKTFSNAAQTIVTLRFDVPPGSQYLGLVLPFEGIHLFEQYAIGKDNAGQFSHSLDLRIPILKDYSKDKKTTVSSRVLIGQDKDDLLRMDLAIPLASPLDDDQYRTRQAFVGFSALYPATFATARFSVQPQALAVENMVFGGQNKGTTKNLVFSGLKLPSAKVLGRFVFARYIVKDSANEYGCVEVDQTKPNNTWWPTADSIVNQMLPALGINTTGVVPATSLEVDHNDISDALLPAPSVAIRPFSVETRNGFRLVQRFMLSQVGPVDVPANANSDLRIKDGGIELRVPGTPGSWISFGKNIHITLTLSGLISDDDLWAQDHDLKVDASIIGAKNFSYSKFSQDSAQLGLRDLNVTGSSFSSLLASTVSAMNRARMALHQLAPDQPQSALPRLTAPAVSTDGDKLIGVFSRFDVHYTAGQPVPIKPSDWSLMLADPNNGDVFNGKNSAIDETSISVEATWPSMHRTPGAILCWLTCDTLDDSSRNLSGMRIGLKPAQPDNQPAPTALLGGLELIHSQGRLLNEGWIRVSARTDPGVKNTTAMLGIELSVTFNVKSVDPVAVDVLRGDRTGRAQPLIYREPVDSTGPGQYLLKCTEVIRSEQQRRLTAALLENVQSNKDSSASLLIGQEPFSVQRFYSMPLDMLGGEDNSIIANYDSDEGAWKFKLANPLYHYVLPPQSVGESMDKPRRLELQDYDANDESNAVGFIRPTVTKDTLGLKRLAVEFRLTPPAHLWVQPNDVERNYSLPEWASDAIFSQHSELGLGCALTSLQGEFIYGLAFGITSKLEKGTARRTRVAEIEALTGRAVPRDDQAAGDKPTRWNLLHKAMQTRPQRLELWADDPSQEVQFAPVRFSEGARFALRTTALHRPAVSSLDPPVNALQGPGAPNQEVLGLSPRLHPFGLSGGALWPIESANVLNLILNQPWASGGSIEKIALSPLGGDADQTVKFNNNRIAIVSETRGGFVQRQKVEVIGRISVFWHRAKHVVVYERTVNPSAQFTPIEGLGTRTRRPVLRKISEYIEILEPERRYPDSPIAAASTSSFLRAMRFNKRIIPVDSLWAEEVDNSGWIVPLWNRHAAKQRPQVYAMPDIAFVLASEGEGDDPQAAQECLNPENLYFFADTSPDQTDNTDAWDVRKGIDYTDLPPPKVALPEAPVANVPAGYARFTWRLAPASQRTTINAGRADKPVYVGLETLTFMRAGRRETNVDSARQQLVEGTSGFIRTAVAAGEAFKGYWGKGGELQGSFATLSSGLASVLNALPSSLPPTAEVDAIKLQLTALGAAITGFDRNELQQKLEGISVKYDEVLKPLKGGLDKLDSSVSKSCEHLSANLATAIGAKRLAIAQEVESWREEWLRQWPAPLPDYFSSRTAFEAYLGQQLNELMQPLFESASGELGKLRRGIETARLTATEAVDAAHACLKQAKVDLDTLQQAIDEQKPWSQGRREQLEKQISDAFAQLDASIKREVASAKMRLAAELDDLAQGVGVAASRAIEGTLQAEQILRLKLETDLNLAGRLKNLRDSLPDHQQIETRIDSARAAIKTIEEKYPGHVATLQPAHQYLENALRVLDDADNRLYPQLSGILVSAENKLSSGVKEAAEALIDVIKALENDTKDLRKNLQGVLIDVESNLLLTLNSAIAEVPVVLAPKVERLLEILCAVDQWLTCVIDLAVADIDAADQWLAEHSEPLYDAINETTNAVLEKVGTLEAHLGGAPLVTKLVESLFKLPEFVLIIDRLGSPVFITANADKTRIAAATSLINSCLDQLLKSLENAAQLLGNLQSDIEKTCGLVSSGLADVRGKLLAAVNLQPFLNGLQSYLDNILTKVDNAFDDAEKYKALFDGVANFDREIRKLGNDLAQSRTLLEGYAERVVDAVGRIGDGGLLAAPTNILRAMAAFGSTPQLPNLDFSSLTSPYFFGRVEDCVDMAPINAWFSRLGDDLKALGLDLPIGSISDRLLPTDLSKLDIGKVLRNVGGLDLASLFKGYTLPSSASDAIRVTHEFDKKNLRAWVQVDVDLPLPERRALFSVGPFTLDVMNARVTAVVRLEASKDSAQVEQSGTATLLTDFDAVVGGQSMVTLGQVAVRFDKNSGLKVDFDPKKIKLNPGFQFIQNTFQSIFGDDIGGLKIIKDNGIPVGVEHLFSLPPMGMMFGTSGVQNIQISNAFRLVAFPDFLISNSFALARSDLPFLFSVFIIGGSGWLTIDVNYRPFQNELAVVVDAAAGGSASLGFSFCGVSGTVSISLNVALTYRKLIGKPGGGLTVSMVVVIVGVVDVLRIASAYIGITLRLSYQENGDIDATGTFRVTIRISRFFSVSAGGQVRYRMTGGKSETTSKTYGDVQSDSYEKAKKLIKGQGR